MQRPGLGAVAHPEYSECSQVVDPDIPCSIELPKYKSATQQQPYSSNAVRYIILRLKQSNYVLSILKPIFGVLYVIALSVLFVSQLNFDGLM